MVHLKGKKYCGKKNKSNWQIKRSNKNIFNLEKQLRLYALNLTHNPGTPY